MKHVITFSVISANIGIANMCKVKTELLLIHFGSRFKLVESVFVLVHTIIKRDGQITSSPYI